MYIAWSDFMFHVVVYCCYGHIVVMLFIIHTDYETMGPWAGTCNKIHCFQPQIRDTFKPLLILTNTKSKNN